MDGKYKTLKRWATATLAVFAFFCMPAAVGWVAWNYAPSHGITKFILDVAETRCRLNTGIKNIQPTGPQRFTIICNNDAHFFDTIVEVRNERMESTPTP